MIRGDFREEIGIFAGMRVPEIRFNRGNDNLNMSLWAHTNTGAQNITLVPLICHLYAFQQKTFLQNRTGHWELWDLQGLCLHHLQCRAWLPSAGRTGGSHMEGGRPSRRLAADPDSTALHTSPTRLPSASATPCHHQEEPEEMLLVPLSIRGWSKRHFDTVMHCITLLLKKKRQNINYGGLF